MLPDFFYEATNETEHPVGGLKPQKWTPETSLSFMDEAGIDVAILSTSTPGIQLSDQVAGRELARRCNELAASLIAQYPKRFGAFASVAMPNIHDAIEEVRYALDVLKLDGVVLFTNSLGVYLGDPTVRPLFDELQKRKAVVYVHPNPSPDPIAHSLGLADNLIDFPTDTTRTIAQLHYGGTFAATPDVKYIFSHAGGTIPYLAHRLSIVDEMKVMGDSSKTGTISESFKRIYWDTALAWSDPILHTLRQIAGISKVVYGTDFPYLRRDLAVKSKIQVAGSAELSDDERKQVLGGNALSLFPRLKSLYNQK
ncbi:amidohydrolase [Chryseolinea soli]|uniref:Amidohydrolase n=2 Tax=Chryseolinea soli TaxID=2321403 RepID=A0A385SVM6_9BACT|nr:amidohydrolase [Chryseolinea soli]